MRGTIKKLVAVSATATLLILASCHSSNSQNAATTPAGSSGQTATQSGGTVFKANSLPPGTVLLSGVEVVLLPGTAPVTIPPGAVCPEAESVVATQLLAALFSAQKPAPYSPLSFYLDQQNPASVGPSCYYFNINDFTDGDPMTPTLSASLATTTQTLDQAKGDAEFQVVHTAVKGTTSQMVFLSDWASNPKNVAKMPWLTSLPDYEVQCHVQNQIGTSSPVDPTVTMQRCCTVIINVLCNPPTKILPQPGPLPMQYPVEAGPESE